MLHTATHSSRHCHVYLPKKTTHQAPSTYSLSITWNPSSCARSPKRGKTSAASMYTRMICPVLSNRANSFSTASHIGCTQSGREKWQSPGVQISAEETRACLHDLRRYWQEPAAFCRCLNGRWIVCNIRGSYHLRPFFEANNCAAAMRRDGTVG